MTKNRRKVTRWFGINVPIAVALAIAAILGHLRRGRLDRKALQEALKTASQLAPDQPEPKLAYALVLLKHNKGRDALASLKEVLRDHPTL